MRPRVREAISSVPAILRDSTSSSTGRLRLRPHRLRRIVFIHGDGDGILRKAIRNELDSTFAAPALTVRLRRSFTAQEHN